jgi:hypothetical protein
LIAVLGREHAARRAAYARFRELWDRFEGEGMRAELVALSTVDSGTREPAGMTAT